jgi:hypothetical protein
MKKVLSICALSLVLLWSSSALAAITTNGRELQDISANRVEFNGFTLNGIIVNGNTIDAQLVTHLTSLSESQFQQKKQLPVELVKLPNS